jgi:hypothetical protein
MFKEGKELSQRGKDRLDEYYAEINLLEIPKDCTTSGALFHTEAIMLRAQGMLRQLEGDKLWFAAIFATYGDIPHAMIKRDGDYDCHLEVPNVEGEELYRWDIELV